MIMRKRKRLHVMQTMTAGGTLHGRDKKMCGGIPHQHSRAGQKYIAPVGGAYFNLIQ